jgi:glyoxylase-like metal-dependent hydrolase (beta-lactamase superfamily II)
MSLKGVVAAAALLVFGAGQVAQAQGPVATPPAAKAFKLGAYELIAVRDADFVPLNDGKTFGINVGPEAVAKALAAAGAPTDKITLGVDGLVVKSPGHVILIDTGLGPSVHGVLLQSLALAHIAPTDVTDVLISHSHGDHVGGLITADGKSAFPNAAIRMSTKEWAYMQSQSGLAAVTSAVAAQVKTFEPGAPILPGVTPVAIDGHTPGHMGYQIESEGHHLLDIGDTAHSSIISLAHPDWVIAFDGDPAVATASRKALLAKLANSQELIFAPHFPFPGVGKIETAGTGYGFKPTE